MALSDLYMGELLLKIVAHQTGEMARVSFTPQKKDFPEGYTDAQPFARALPEERGLSSAFVKRLLTRLQEDAQSKMHKLMMVKDNAVIAEHSFGPYPLNTWHVTHSMCKSVTGMAIGLLIDEGKISLEDKLFDIFSRKPNVFDLLFPKEITIRHLLTMTSGVQFNEAGVLTGDDWVGGYLGAPLNFTPGTLFEYNSMNSYMLSAVVTEVTGESMAEYLRPRVFTPLGIEAYLWEACPKGITKGGWGMYLRIEDMCKLGQLYLQEGRWNDKQVIPADWVKASVTSQADTSKSYNVSNPIDNYGYHVWVNADRPGAFTYNGMLGQNVFCYPDVRMIVATNAANDDVFQSGNMSKIIRQMMAEELDAALMEPVLSIGTAQPPAALPPVLPKIARGGWRTLRRRETFGSRSLRATSGMLRSVFFRDTAFAPAPKEARLLAALHVREALLNALNGHVYDTGDTGIGTLPLMVQVFHFNFTKGIHAIGFRYTEEKDFFIDLYEGEESMSIACNFTTGDAVSRIDVNGEKYIFTAISNIQMLPERKLLFTNRLHLHEESTMRHMDFLFDVPETGMPQATPLEFTVRMNEDPGAEMITASMKQVSGAADGSIGENASVADLLIDGTKAIIKKGLKELGAIDTLRKTIEETVAPEFTARLRKDT